MVKVKRVAEPHPPPYYELDDIYQATDAGLDDIAGLTPADGAFIVGDGSNWVAESGSTARTSLGLGTAATQNTGTSGANVPLLNGSNTWSSTQTGTIFRVNNGTSSVPTVSFTNDTDTGLYLNADGVLGITTAASLVARFGGANNQVQLGNGTANTSTAFSLVTSGRLQSDATYSVTTGDAANVAIASTGLMARSTSALKYKRDLEPITDEQIAAYLSLTGYTYSSRSPEDDPSKRFFGLIADHALAAGLDGLVTLDHNGEPEGYAYGRDNAILLEIVKRQERAIADLTARLEALEAR